MRKVIDTRPMGKPRRPECDDRCKDFYAIEFGAKVWHDPDTHELAGLALRAELNGELVVSGELTVSATTGEVWKHGQPIYLSNAPRKIIRTLALRPNRIVDHMTLGEEGLGYTDSPDNITSYMWRLRREIGDVRRSGHYSWRHIDTAPGWGFRLNVPPKGDPL